jgi:uncharacterized protein YndB with AHSA1/START domain
MATKSGQEGSARVSRIIKAPRRAIYQALRDPEALVSWLPPKDMTGRLHEFDARRRSPPSTQRDQRAEGPSWEGRE